MSNSYTEYQQSVIGAIFLDSSCLDDVTQIVKSHDFDERHKPIYDACLEVADSGGIPDLVTVSKLYSDSTYLVELVDFCPTVANVKYYAKGVSDFSQRRNIGSILSSGLDKLKEGDNPTAWVESQLMNMRTDKNDVMTMREVLKSTMVDIDNIAHHGMPMGYKTGVADLDGAGCFQDGALVIVAARPAMGKSVLGAQLLLQEEQPGLMFTLEMGNNQLCKRLIASEGKLNLKNIKNAQLNIDQEAKFSQGTEKLAAKQIYFCEAAGLSIQDIRAKARLMVRKHGVKKIVVDYIQLCTSDDGSNREQEISSITRNLKLMAMELNVCVIALSQLNRSLENRDNKRPRMSDLRESGAIEQDADVIIFIYRDVVYNRGAPEKEAELIIAKYRDGEICFIPCLFIGEHQRFISEYKG